MEKACPSERWQPGCYVRIRIGFGAGKIMNNNALNINYRRLHIVAVIP